MDPPFLSQSSPVHSLLFTYKSFPPTFATFPLPPELPTQTYTLQTNNTTTQHNHQDH
jgi:hypothetical protein